jgi:F-type H+-transporting ATPase subunit b
MNPLLTVDLGLYVWTLVIFMTVLFVLKKYAWNPLLDFIEEREKDIANSLSMAESAKSDLEKIKDNSKITDHYRFFLGYSRSVNTQGGGGVDKSNINHQK